MEGFDRNVVWCSMWNGWGGGGGAPGDVKGRKLFHRATRKPAAKGGQATATPKRKGKT